MRAEDESDLLKTLYFSAEMVLDHEQHRVQLAVITQFVGIIGNNPRALLAIRCGHIKVILLSDPKERYSHNHEQFFCWMSNNCDRNEFGIPDIPNEPCLLLCPHVNLLALILQTRLSRPRT